MTQLAFNWNQAGHLERVSSRIGAAVLEFCQSNRTFHAGDLHRYVAETTGITAPGSADRILRDLRKRGVVGYRVISRRESLYEITSVTGAAGIAA